MTEYNDSPKTLSHHDRVTKRLLELLDRTDYVLVQENGQRRFTAPSAVPRMKGAEVFLGRLPRDCYEDELVPILEKIGRVVELRLMMDFSGSTRGYAFALFDNPRVARLVCQKINGYEIRPGHHIGVVKSIDNCRLFLGGVPKDKSKSDFMSELGKLLDGITNVYLYPSTEGKDLNRGFVFVEFKDHRSAAMARRKLIPGRVLLWDHEVAVDWADPEPGDDIDDDIMETVTTLFVRNLSLGTSEVELKKIFQNVTNIPIMKIKKINHFAFLHYENREQAQNALNIMTQPNLLVGGENWEITWAKPIKNTEKIHKRQNYLNDASKIHNNGYVAGEANTYHMWNNKVKHKGDRMTNNRFRNGILEASHGVKTIDAKISDYYCDYSTMLRNFVGNELHGEVHYENYNDNANTNYVCKVVIMRDDHVLFQCQGDPSATLQNAINSTSYNAYIWLRSFMRGDLIESVLSYDSRKSVQPFEDHQLFSSR